MFLLWLIITFLLFNYFNKSDNLIFRKLWQPNLWFTFTVAYRYVLLIDSLARLNRSFSFWRHVFMSNPRILFVHCKNNRINLKFVSNDLLYVSFRKQKPSVKFTLRVNESLISRMVINLRFHIHISIVWIYFIILKEKCLYFYFFTIIIW